MKAMMLEEFGKPLRLREVNDPEPLPGEVLLAVSASGVCGTDLKIVSGGIGKVAQAGLPRIPGHEIAGTVVAVGAGVDSSWIGIPVVVYFYLYCGSCPACSKGLHQLCGNLRGQIGFTVDGGWAQFVKAPVENVVDARGIPAVKAAVVADAVATPYHALVTRGKISRGERCLVIGAGGLGLHAIQIARAVGADVAAIDISQSKIELARSFGAEGFHFDDVAAGRHLARGKFDVVFDTVGISESMGTGLRSLAPHGRAVVVGYKEGVAAGVEPALMVRSELVIMGARASGKAEVVEAVRMVREGKVMPVIGKVFPMEAVNEAIASVKQGEVSGRAVLTMADQAS